MALRALSGLVSVVLAGASLAAATGQRRSVWPPPVQRVPEISPPLSAEAEMKTFHLPPGYRVELVAKEPLVQDPIAMDYDADGRLFVLEMPGFAFDRTMADSREPIGRVVRLDDLDGDGRMDTRTVFLDGLVLPRALKVLDRGLLVGEPPNLWLARDTDGDGKADEKTRVRADFGRADGNLEHDANGLLWAMDNVIYTSEHDWHLRPRRDGTFDAEPTLPRGQWGLSMDDAGRLFRNFNTEALFVDIVPARYYMRNPHLVRTRGLYESLVDPNQTAIWPVRPTRGINRGYRDGLLRPDGTAAYYAGASSPVIYRGDRLPADLAGDAFIVDSPTNLVHRLKVVDDGQGRLSAHDAYARGEFLASTDERFRPVNLYSAPDGTLQVVDMYRGVVQDARYQTEYLRDYILKRGLELPVGRGRIFRIVHDSTRRDARPALSRETPVRLVTYLSHPNGWWRDTAQRLLVERGDASASALPALTQLAREAPAARTRLHALWTLDGLQALDRETALHALRDASADVRASALRLAERWLRANDGDGADAGDASGRRSADGTAARSGNLDTRSKRGDGTSASAAKIEPSTDGSPARTIREAVIALTDDANWMVRRQLAASLGELPPDARIAPLVTLLERFGDDAMVVDAAVSGLSGQEAFVLDRLLDRLDPSRDPPLDPRDAARTPEDRAHGQASDDAARGASAGASEQTSRADAAQTRASGESSLRTDAIAMLAGAAARAGDPAVVQRLVAQATDPARTQAERLALLSGIEAGLSLTTDITANRGGMPAGATGRAAIAGGAAAGQSGAAASAVSGGAGRAAQTARPLTRLDSEPLALSRLAAGSLAPPGGVTPPAGAVSPAPASPSPNPSASQSQSPSANANANASGDAREARGARAGAEESQLAAQILARLTWPGKPAPTAPLVVPLTAAQQARFDAGADLYAGLCVACHQPDGRGKDKVAPPLAGSRLALAPPGVPARILLAGKDGPIGLMPPLGALSDDQMAAVLTYVRRAWGNGASPVEPALIKEIRALTASHTRPWTDAELTSLAAPPRE